MTASHPADGDMIFVSAFGTQAAQRQATVTAGPLWKKLGAVKAGHVQVVNDEVWMTDIGVSPPPERFSMMCGGT
jgi:iron complex transport system substrate-binding protein